MQQFGCLILITDHQSIPSTRHYDFIFVGLGASASLTLLALKKQQLLLGKSILIIEPEAKNNNDKTYCFWASETDSIVKDLKTIISKSWTSVSVANQSKSPLLPLQYWQISSIDLYQKLDEMTSDFGWERMAKKVEAIQTNQADKPFIQIDYQILTADIIFDSRNPQFHTPKNFETHLWQSFVGWKIKTKELYFQPNDFRMMDFTTPQDNFTQFVYVLPYSEHEALIEITRFGKEVIPQDLAELRLTEYIHNFNVAYSIEDTETGCIPMSNAQLKTHPLPGVINLGGRANLIKPSTGYAFKSMYSHADKIAETIKRQTTNSLESVTLESHPLFPTTAPSRFKFYDSLLLKILDQQPHWGKPIFEQLFNRVQIPQVMQFLDEKTTLIQDIHILRKLPFKPFLRVLFQHPFVQSLFRPFGLLLITVTLLLLGNSYLQTIIGDSLLILGLITVGIPHGAVDHLLETKQWNKQTAPGFIVKYLLIGALFAATWLLLPNLCLMFFLLYSAWHFGQADGELWRMSKPQTLSWGTTVLSFIILSHWKESAEIISGITGTNWNTFQISGDLPSKLQFISPFIALVFFPWVYYSVKN
ncbi:MAG: lycopene cyclase family protein, partial [Bacteroidota bacterium]